MISRDMFSLHSDEPPPLEEEEEEWRECLCFFRSPPDGRFRLFFPRRFFPVFPMAGPSSVSPTETEEEEEGDDDDEEEQE